VSGLSEWLMVEGGTIRCGACGAEIGPVSADWKKLVVRKETPLAKVGAYTYATGAEGVVLRQFFCRSCATLLETETARPEDPSLVDRLAVGPEA
jgi:N-methylhydantoinase B